MRLERKDFRHGLVIVRCENLDDLWYLSQTVAAGDLVRGRSQRRIKDKDDTKSSGGERKTITITVSVEKAEFKAENSVLRVSGVIVECPDDAVACGSHHTFNVDAETAVTVIKQEWTKTDVERLEEAVKGTLRPKVIVASIDEGEAAVGLIRESRTDYYDLASNIGGKYDVKGRDARKGEFYKELTQLIANVMAKENVSHVILAGPGFEKNNYLKFLRENHPDFAQKCAVEDTGNSGRNGIQEVLKRDAVNRTLAEVNSVRDIRYVEEILKHVGQGTGLSTYGRREVEEAVKAGAVELLLITDTLLFAKRGELEWLMNQVRHMSGRPHIINHESEAGQKLESLGGIAAKLRYRMA